MAQYKNNIDSTPVEAVPWNGDISAMNAFLVAFPPALNPKVTEDNPNAKRDHHARWHFVYPLDGVPVAAALTDMLIRSDVDHGLSTMTAAAFASAYTLVA